MNQPGDEMTAQLQRVDMDDDEHRAFQERCAELCKQQARLEDRKPRRWFRWLRR